MARTKRPEEWRSWLKLPTKADRIAALPETFREKVLSGHAAQWSGKHSRIERHDVKVALINALDEGAEIPPEKVTSLNASLRSAAQRREKEVGSNTIIYDELPATSVLFLFAYYGKENPIEIWRQTRIYWQQEQSRWSTEREERAAQDLMQRCGGMPSHQQIPRDGDCYGLRQRLSTKGSAEAFAKKYRLPRALKTAPNGFWETTKGQEVTKNRYLKLVQTKGRFVNSHEIGIHLKTEDCGGIKPGTFASHIRKGFGSLKNLLFELIDEGRVPKDWARENYSKVTFDGRVLQSYQEVWFYEAFLKFVEAQGLCPSIFSIAPQAGIPGTLLTGSGKPPRADFLIAKQIYVEVLQFSLDEMESPTRSIVREYRDTHLSHMEAYQAAGIEPVLVEPFMLKRDFPFYEMIEVMVNRVQLGFRMDRSSINLSNPHLCVQWPRPETRDKYIRKILAARDPSDPPFGFPTHTEFSNSKLSGLLFYLKQENRKGIIDWQTEALRVGCVASHQQVRAGANPIRPVTSAELVELQRRHRFDFNDWETLRQLFGSNSLYYILHSLHPDKMRIPANVTGHSGDRDRFAHGHHAGVSFVL